MALGQAYALTGRRQRPNYVDEINARRPYLGRRKELEDQKAYRERTLGLETDRQAAEEAYRNRLFGFEESRQAGEADYRAATLAAGEDRTTKEGLYRDKAFSAQETWNIKEAEIASNWNIYQKDKDARDMAFARQQADYKRRAGDRASAIGLGNLFMKASQGRQRDKAGGFFGLGGKDGGGGPRYADDAGGGFYSNLKEGASNIGPIASSTLAGGTVGARLTSRFIDDTPVARGFGGAAASGMLNYAQTGNVYSAGLSAIFGGLLGGLFKW